MNKLITEITKDDIILSLVFNEKYYSKIYNKKSDFLNIVAHEMQNKIGNETDQKRKEQITKFIREILGEVT